MIRVCRTDRFGSTSSWKGVFAFTDLPCKRTILQTDDVLGIDLLLKLYIPAHSICERSHNCPNVFSRYL